MKQHFKGVIWPHGPVKGKIVGQKKKQNIYRYVVVGMIVTDKPVIEFEGENELFFDGPSNDLIQPFTKIKTRKMRIEPGNANAVLTSLDDL